MIIVWQTEKRAVLTVCGELRRLRRGNKRVDTCGFPPLAPLNAYITGL